MIVDSPAATDLDGSRLPVHRHRRRISGQPERCDTVSPAHSSPTTKGSGYPTARRSRDRDARQVERKRWGCTGRKRPQYPSDKGCRDAMRAFRPLPVEKLGGSSSGRTTDSDSVTWFESRSPSQTCGGSRSSHGGYVRMPAPRQIKDIYILARPTNHAREQPPAGHVLCFHLIPTVGMKYYEILTWYCAALAFRARCLAAPAGRRR